MKIVGRKKVWLILLSATTALITLITIYIALVVGEISSYNLSSIPVSTTNLPKSQLEVGSIVNYQDLKSYFQFSHLGKSNFQLWLRELEHQGIISRQSSPLHSISIEQEVALPPLFPNECTTVYCYQHKLPFDLIPSIFWKGLIGIEDNRFLHHFGIDFRSIARAFITDIIQMRMAQGGSTLTQQLAKNLFLTNRRTIERKIREMIYSIYIELNYPKEKILEAYFNHIYWGAIQGIRAKGIYAASIFYFNKRPAEISPYEASILIAMLKGPNFYHPLRHLQRLQKRTSLVYGKLDKLNLFPSKDERIWGQERWQQWQKQLIARNNKRDLLALWSIHQRQKKSIKTTSPSLLNQYEQFVFHKSAFQQLQRVKQLIPLPSSSFAIKAVIGKPFDQNSDPYIFYSKLERNIQSAITKEPHQIGSIIKPIIYSIYFELGQDPSNLVSTRPITLNLLSGKWKPKESSRNLPSESTLAVALQRSFNRPVIRIAQEVGFSTLESKLLAYIPKLQTPLAEYPAQLLGSIEMSLNALYLTYQKFLYHECSKIDGPDIISSKNVLGILSDPTKTTIRKRVDQYLGQMKFLGKTGTSNNSHDNWFVFFDGELLGIIWLGIDGRQPDQNIRLSGSSTAFQIFQHWIMGRGKQFNQFRCPKVTIPAK
ncbi:MAG: hypothetical protein HN353_12755 [Bdellovibrionales bacterium]|nr:hypothetical protein [Bdellovibrionales bacterium]MBT3525337.1 hypothetical protein [Bdellovibrionales bacterium]MBT7766902.1 hypothetical protein [Bdellovibrionales bacterium]